MRHSIRTLAVVLTVAAASALAPASFAKGPGDIPLYNLTYYSDASLTEAVGYHVGMCNGNNPAWYGPLQGQSSAYSVEEQVGVCRGGYAIYW